MSDSKPSTRGCKILLVSGSLRAGSVNTAVVKTAQALAPASIEATIYTRLADLPHFNPDDDRDPLPEPAAHMREQLDGVDALFVSTPEYAGSLPGSFKNFLDWGVGGGLHEVPVGWVNPSAYGGAKGTYQALRTVLAFTNSPVVEPACIDVPVPRDAVGADGIIIDEGIRAAIGRALGALAEHVHERRRGEARSATSDTGRAHA
jgi:chromate reductase, NAD(P)H dehydrogenase (quinone)